MAGRKLLIYRADPSHLAVEGNPCHLLRLNPALLQAAPHGHRRAGIEILILLLDHPGRRIIQWYLLAGMRHQLQAQPVTVIQRSFGCAGPKVDANQVIFRHTFLPGSHRGKFLIS